MNTKNYNEYEKIISNFYHEYKVQSIFLKINENYIFNDFEYEIKFSEVLRDYLGNYCNLTMEYPNCNKEIEIKEKKKIIKILEILIITQEIYQVNQVII